jgi:hypothetical protein
MNSVTRRNMTNARRLIWCVLACVGAVTACRTTGPNVSSSGTEYWDPTIGPSWRDISTTIVRDAFHAEPTQSASASVTVAPDSEGIKGTQIVNQRFLLPISARERGVLLRETQVIRCCFEGEHGYNSSIAIAAWLNGTGVGRADWSATVAADRGELAGSFYVATLDGCCGGANLDMYVNTHTGKIEFINTGRDGPQPLGLPSVTDDYGRTVRFAAFHDMNATVGPPEARQFPDLIGILQYGPPGGPIRKVAVRRSTPIVHARLLNVAFADSMGERRDIWVRPPGAGQSAFGGFEIIVRIQEETADAEVRIPVVSDRLDIGGARMPPTYRLTAM